MFYVFLGFYFVLHWTTCSKSFFCRSYVCYFEFLSLSSQFYTRFSCWFLHKLNFVPFLILYVVSFASIWPIVFYSLTIYFVLFQFKFLDKEEFNDLKYLKRIHLDGNQLTVVTDNLFQRQRSLEYLGKSLLKYWIYCLYV